MAAQPHAGAAKRAAVARLQIAHLLARVADQDGAQPLFKLVAEAAPRRSQAGQSFIPQRCQQLRHPIAGPGHQPPMQAQALAGTQIVYQQRDLGPNDLGADVRSARERDMRCRTRRSKRAALRRP
jgi:hypothetical protein